MAAVVSEGALRRIEGHVAGPAFTVVDPGVPLGSWPQDVDVARLWATQPSLRKVVDFIARAIASVPLHVHDRVSDTDRRRVTSGPLAVTIGQPAPNTTAYRWLYRLVVDWMLYDRWCAIKAPRLDGEGLHLHHIPSRRVHFHETGLGVIDRVQIDGYADPIDPAACLFDRGWGGADGVSPLETLSALLEENAEAVRWRRSVWRNGARVQTVIERPATAPAWSAEAKQRFSDHWRSAYASGGVDAAGTPILEDGMALKTVDAFSARDALDLEGRRLTDAEVASAFHIAPELVGAREGTYSNIEAYRQMLYRDSLGPSLIAFEQVVNAMVAPDVDPGGAQYVEFAIEAKLRGSFEEQAQVLSTAVGAPWMARREARARLNLPEIDEAELVTPLNVLVGGLASPRDTAPKHRAGVKAVDLAGMVTERDTLASSLERFYARQASEVLAALSTRKAAPDLHAAWDAEHWDRLLAAVLLAHSIRAATSAAEEITAVHEVDFDPDVMEPWLAKAASNDAAAINRSTYDRLAVAVTEPDWPTAVGAVFAALRITQQAETLTTQAASFGRHDAAKASGLRTKTWITGVRPRDTHAAMDGETVDIDDVFSNGARWPGDPALSADERAGCNCRLEYGAEEVT